MSKEQEGGAPFSSLSVSKPLFWIFILSFSFIVLLALLTQSSTSSFSNQKVANLFPLSAQANLVSFKIINRRDVDYQGAHLIYLHVQVPEGLNQTQLKAIAQKVVKDLIKHENFYSVSIDFGKYGYTEFKPPPSLKLSSPSLADYSFTYIFY